MKYIHKLSKLPHELNFGGKAEALNILMQNNAPVPEGCAVAAEAFENGALCTEAEAELVILQSGSLRRKAVGPEIYEKDLREFYPFDDAFLAVEISGSELLEMFGFLFSLKEDGSVMNGTFSTAGDSGLWLTARIALKKSARYLNSPLTVRKYLLTVITRWELHATALKISENILICLWMKDVPLLWVHRPIMILLVGFCHKASLLRQRLTDDLRY